MDYFTVKNILYFTVSLLLTLLCGLAFAVAPPAPAPIFSRIPLAGYVPSVQGPFYVNPAAFPTYAPHVENAPFDIKTPRGTVPAHVPVTINAAVPRLASSVGAFALKALPYAGLAVLLYDEICSLTGYCNDPSQPSGFGVSAPPPDGWTVDESGFMHAPSTVPAVQVSDAGVDVCQWLYDSTAPNWVPNYDIPVPTCRVTTANGSNLYQTHCCYATAPTGYTWDGGTSNTASKTGSVPNDNTPIGTRDATNADRVALASNTALNTPSVVPALSGAGEPVPIDDPVVTPVSVDGPSSDVVNRDAAGNPVSTTRTQTTQDITPAPIPGDPLRVQISETTTSTVINNAGDVISSTVTTINTPADEKQEKDSTVKFDAPVAKAIPTGQLPGELTPQNWGSSATCPADPVISYAGGKTMTIPVHVVCDAMGFLKPVVLLIASMAAGLIIMGAVRS